MTNSSIEVSKLKNGSKLLIYYVRMYLDSLVWLNNTSQVTNGWNFLYNSVLESHLIFSRLLIEFLTSEVKQVDDVFAVMYFADTGFSPFPKESTILEVYRKRVSKLSAHITVINYPDFKIKSNQFFEIKTIAAVLVPLLQEFFDMVAPEKIDDGIHEFAQQLLSQNSPLGSGRPISPST